MGERKMNKKLYLTLLSILVLLLMPSCVNTNVKKDVTEQSELEKISFENVISESGLSEYQNSIDTVEYTITEETVINEIKKNLESYLEYEKIKDRTIRDDDTVRLKTICECNGKMIKNFTFKESDYKMSDNTLPSFIKNSIIGTSPADVNILKAVTVLNRKEIEYINDYPELSYDNSGEQAEVTCYITIEYILGELNLPDDIDSAIAKHTSHKYTSYDSYYNHIKMQLESKKKNELLYETLDGIIADGVLTIEADISPYIRAEYNSLIYYYNNIKDSYSSEDHIYYAKDDIFIDSDSLKELSEKLAKRKIIFYYISQENNWNLDDDALFEKIKTNSKKYGFNSIPEAVNVFGSDLLRWEAFKDSYIEDFLSKYVHDYRSNNAESESAQISHSNKSIMGTVIKEKHI